MVICNVIFQSIQNFKLRKGLIFVSGCSCFKTNFDSVFGSILARMTNDQKGNGKQDIVFIKPSGLCFAFM